MLSLNIPQYLCVYEVNNAIHLILLQARDADTAELFTLLNTMLESLNDINLENVREETDETDLSGELACAGGSCEITSL